MKQINVLLYAFLFLFIYTGIVFSQEMNPEAGKLYNEGNKLLKAGNYDGALEQYNQALKIEKDYRIYYQRGISLKKLGNLEEAKKYYSLFISFLWIN